MNTKDYTKYIFQNKICGKGRLVLEVIKEFVRNNPEITFQKLLEEFPNALQEDTRIQFSDKRVVIAKLGNISEKDLKRFHLETEDIICLIDAKVVVSREWNLENIKSFIDKAMTLGFDIEVN